MRVRSSSEEGDEVKKFTTLLLTALLATGCSTGGLDVSSDSPSQAQSAAQQPPGEHNVSTMKEGEEFEAEPNFYYFEGCGHPCDLGVYPSPTPEKGTPSITDKFPLEASEGRQADRVLVVCQVAEGAQMENDAGAYSSVWNKVRIPKAHLTVDALADLPQDNDGFGYGFAPDIWMGNTGLHGPPCS